MNSRYGTFWQRFFAGVIDGLVLLPLNFIEDTVEDFRSATAIIIGLTVVHGMQFSYTIIMHWQTGQTLGKMIMRIKVLHVSESRLLSLRESFLRDSVYVMMEAMGLIVILVGILQNGYYERSHGSLAMVLGSIGLFWFLVELTTMFSNDKRRAFHDLMAHSVVVDETIPVNANR